LRPRQALLGVRWQSATSLPEKTLARHPQPGIALVCVSSSASLFSPFWLAALACGPEGGWMFSGGISDDDKEHLAALGFRKRRQAAYLYPKKHLLDIALALPRKSREGPPRPGPLLPRRRGSRLGDQSAKRRGRVFGRRWFSKAAASCAHSKRFARYGPGGEGGSRRSLPREIGMPATACGRPAKAFLGKD